MSRQVASACNTQGSKNCYILSMCARVFDVVRGDFAPRNVGSAGNWDPGYLRPRGLDAANLNTSHGSLRVTSRYLWYDLW